MLAQQEDENMWLTIWSEPLYCCQSLSQVRLDPVDEHSRLQFSTALRFAQTSCTVSRGDHPTISSSANFFSCLQSFRMCQWSAHIGGLYMSLLVLHEYPRQFSSSWLSWSVQSDSQSPLQLPQFSINSLRWWWTERHSAASPWVAESRTETETEPQNWQASLGLTRWLSHSTEQTTAYVPDLCRNTVMSLLFSPVWVFSITFLPKGASVFQAWAFQLIWVILGSSVEFIMQNYWSLI